MISWKPIVYISLACIAFYGAQAIFSIAAVICGLLAVNWLVHLCLDVFGIIR